MAISRYVLEHHFASSWFPLWYAGVPYQNTYPPLLHLFVALVSWMFGMSPAHAHHAVCACFYSLGPVTLYWMARNISQNTAAGFLAAVIFSVFSPSVWLVPSVRTWADSSGNAARLKSLVLFGDGPHIAALTLLPLAILALHWSLNKWCPLRVFTAALAFVAVVLTNWLGAFALTLGVVCYTAARLSERGWHPLVFRVSLVAAVAYGLSAPWIPPSTLGAVYRNAQIIGGSFPLTIRQAVFTVLIILAAWLLSRYLLRFRTSLFVRFMYFFLFLTSLLVLTEAWFGVYLVPQPHRYHLELDIAVCLAAGFFLENIWRRMSSSRQKVFLGLIAVLLVSGTINSRRIARRTIQSIDISQTIEFKASRWLDQNYPGKRVFLSGSTQFWLNLFANTPQLGGGFGQGIIDPILAIVHYDVPFVEGDGPALIRWLRLFGIQAVVVSEANGRDSYREVWRDPAKFHKLLPEIWRQGGEVIYSVPQKSDSLAHVILPAQAAVRAPLNVYDEDPVRTLARALEDPTLPNAHWEWLGPSHARIAAPLSRSQILFVQISYHPGWHASVHGAPRRVRAEPLGMMLIEPDCEGACEVDLVYDGGREMEMSNAATVVTILAGTIWMLSLTRRSRGDARV